MVTLVLSLFILVACIILVVVLSLKLKNGNIERQMALDSAKDAEDKFKRLQKSQSQVIHTTKMKSLNSLVAGIAHEVNTPLGFVGSNVEVVRDLLTEFSDDQKNYENAVDQLLDAGGSALKGEKARVAIADAKNGRSDETLLKDAFDLLKDCSEGIDQIAAIITNLKSFSRVDRDGQDLIDINSGLDSAIKMGHQALKGVLVTRKFGTIPKIKAMASQLNQVFLNIITNAGHAMEGKGKLLISTKQVDDSIEIVFADSGSGIAEDILPNIFDPFFTTKDVGEGTGLGLSISYKIIHGHGGEITARSVPGRGTFFTIILPVSFDQTVCEAARQ